MSGEVSRGVGVGEESWRFIGVESGSGGGSVATESPDSKAKARFVTVLMDTSREWNGLKYSLFSRSFSFAIHFNKGAQRHRRMMNTATHSTRSTPIR